MSGEREMPASEELNPVATNLEKMQEPTEDQGEETSELTGEETQEATQEVVESLSLDELSRQLELANSKADDNWNKFVRTQAEMENLRRRTEKDLQNAHKYGLEKFIRELLPVVDSLELGIKAATADLPEIHKLREGSELTLKLFASILEKFNCFPIDPLGEVFNPERHQAMSMQPSADAEPNTVLTVFQKGYLLNERLIRPAMVVVAQAEAPQTKIDEQA